MKNRIIIPAVITLSSVFALNPANAETASTFSASSQSALTLIVSHKGAAQLQGDTALHSSAQASSSQETAAEQSADSRTELSVQSSAQASVALNREGIEQDLDQHAETLAGQTQQLAATVIDRAEHLRETGQAAIAHRVSQSSELALRVGARAEQVLASNIEQSMAIAGEANVEALVDDAVLTAISSATEAALESMISENLDAALTDTLDRSLESAVESSVAATLDNSIHSALDI